MVYNFKYPTELKNGILINCSECKLSILKKIDGRDKIEFKEEYRESVLHFIIMSLHYSHENNHNYPEKTRQYVTNELLEQSQFTKKEIDSVYEMCEYLDYPKEWDEYLKENGITDAEIVSYVCLCKDSNDSKNKIESLAKPRNYLFNIFPCIVLQKIGLCFQKLEEYSCQKCGCITLNTPENVDAYFNLLCPSCQNIVKKSDLPKHHGHWEKRPIIEDIGTDYLAIYHDDCPESKDGKGEMYPKGIWVENSRLIINFKCISCGYENVLKYFIRGNESPISVYSKSESDNPVKLKEIKYRVFDCLADKERGNIEFKCSFYGIHDGTLPSQKNILKAKKQVVNTIASFINSEGGTLIIGIDDESNEIIGISEDLIFASPGKSKNLDPEDYYLLHLKDALQAYLFNYEIAISNVSFNLEKIPSGEIVCIIDVQRGNHPVFTTEKSIYVSLSNSKKELKGDMAKNYIKERFNIDISL